MPQTAVPIATVSNEWSLIPGTGEDAHEDIDEGVDTSDDGTTQAAYVSVFGDPDRTIEVLLGPLTAPPFHAGHTIRLRLNQTGAGIFVPPGYAELRQGSSTLIATTQVFDKAELSGWTTFSYLLTEAEAAAITDYSDLRIRLYSGRQFSPTLQTAIRCSAAELRIPDLFVNTNSRAGHAVPGGAAGSYLGPAQGAG